MRWHQVTFNRKLEIWQFCANAVMIFMHHKNTQSVMAFPLAGSCAFASQGGWPQAISSQTRSVFGGAERQAGQPPGKTRSTRFCFLGRCGFRFFFVPHPGDSASFCWQDFCRIGSLAQALGPRSEGQLWCQSPSWNLVQFPMIWRQPSGSLNRSWRCQVIQALRRFRRICRS